MSYPIPPGTRDILPDEMRELRALSTALLETFDRFGYGEVWTPTMEYEDVLVQGDERAAGASYRLFDENGQVLALRSDMTIPIARLVATRFADGRAAAALLLPVPRLPRGAASARAAARVPAGGHRADRRDAPDGTVEVLEVLCAALDAAGLPRARVGLGDAGLYPGCSRAWASRVRRARACWRRSSATTSSSSRARSRELGVGRSADRMLTRASAAARGPRGDRAGGRARGRRRAAARLAPARRRRRASTREGIAERVIFDLGLVRDLGYYTGAIFEVYDPALGHVIGGGGRYDELLGRFGRPLPGLRLRAVRGARARRAGRGGAADRGDGSGVSEPLRLAVPRGALFGETLDLLDAIGLDTAPLRSDSRSLLFPGEEVTLVTLRPSDVPTYVEAGAVDLGITGKDVLMEQQERVVYELLDLGYGHCRMVVADAGGNHFADELERRLGAIRIATKYPRIATRYFEESGRQAEVIEVKGSVELAPIAGLADGIVDLTATGRTLRENDLEIREVIADCTARLVANRVAHKLRQAEIDALVERIGAR